MENESGSLVVSDEVKNDFVAFSDRVKMIIARIVDDAGYRDAGECLQAIKRRRTQYKEIFGPNIKRLYEAHRAATKQLNSFDDPMAGFELAVKRGMGSYTETQERIRREEEARLQAEARKREEESRIKEAEQLEAAGETEQAEAVLEAPIITPPIVMPTAPKAAGVSTRKTYYAEVYDLKALVKAVAEGKASIGLLMANQSALNMQAKSLQDSMSLPGVRVKYTTTVSARQ